MCYYIYTMINRGGNEIDLPVYRTAARLLPACVVLIPGSWNELRTHVALARLQLVFRRTRGLWTHICIVFFCFLLMNLISIGKWTLAPFRSAWGLSKHATEELSLRSEDHCVPRPAAGVNSRRRCAALASIKIRFFSVSSLTRSAIQNPPLNQSTLGFRSLQSFLTTGLRDRAVAVLYVHPILTWDHWVG